MIKYIFAQEMKYIHTAALFDTQRK